MSSTQLVLGLLDNADQFPSAVSAARARDLTIAWSRFKYSGPIIEAESLDDLLRQCARTGASHCLVQSFGSILTEVWRPEDGEIPEITSAISAWIETQNFFITGRILPNRECGAGLDPGFLLVDLSAYRELGCPVAGPPPWRALIAAGKKSGLIVEDIPHSMAASLIVLDPSCPEVWTPKPGEHEPDAAIESPAMAGREVSPQENFPAGIRWLSSQLRKGIFVWNLESYEDIEQPSEYFSPPLQALYTVSAGFKPNRILQTHGFDGNTRVVVFDYSRQGLEFRRRIHEDWDGIDYPGFLKVLMKQIPHGKAFYLLWDGMTPDNLDWSQIRHRWEQELRAWGGEESIHAHWQKFRRLNIEYLHCDVLTEHDRLLERIDDDDSSLIWWSNAFFSVHSNWLYSMAQRTGFYRQWIRKLAEKAPKMLLYGSDCHNVSVNCYPAGLYGEWFEKAMSESGGDLRPPSLHRHEIRF